MLEQEPAPQLRDLVMKGERVRLEGRDHKKAYHYWTIDGCKKQPLISCKRTTGQYVDVCWEFTARTWNDELYI